MDAEHRHELKTNELADWIGHLPEFCKKNGSTIIGVVLIIAAIISYFGFKTKKDKANVEQQIQTSGQIQKVIQNKEEVVRGVISGTPVVLMGFEDSAKTLLKAADEATEPQFAAMALIKRGEAIRAELHYTAGDVENDIIISQVALAKESYEKALEKADGNRTLAAMATYGLGLCEEELGDFAKASEIFTGITNNEGFKGTTFPTQAQYRLDIMADHEKQFTFIEAPAEEVVIPEGFDASAAEALKRGDIHVESAPVEVEVPAVEVETVPEAKVVEPEVYDVGPTPPSKTEEK